jgi:hypothetical protein
MHIFGRSKIVHNLKSLTPTKNVPKTLLQYLDENGVNLLPGVGGDCRDNGGEDLCELGPNPSVPRLATWTSGSPLNPPGGTRLT